MNETTAFEITFIKHDRVEVHNVKSIGTKFTEVILDNGKQYYINNDTIDTMKEL